MKKIIGLIIGIFITTTIFSQELQDVVYLKNGSIIKGCIISQVPNEYIIIKTSDGQLYTFNFPQIEQIEKTQVTEIDGYGGGLSYGISLGGFGLIGLQTRIYVSEKFAFELGTSYNIGAGVSESYGNTSKKYIHTFIISGGSNFYLTKLYKKNKQKIKLNGITIKAGGGFVGFNTTVASCGWIHESFRLLNKTYSFTLELGPGILYTYNLNKTETINFASYLKVQWNWHSK